MIEENNHTKFNPPQINVVAMPTFDTEKNKKVDGQELAASRFMDIIVMSVSVQQLELSFFSNMGSGEVIS